MDEPTFDDIVAARAVVSKHLPHTPTFTYPALSQAFGCEVVIKHENHQPVGSFKVRGGIALLSSLPPEERERGVVTATRGNHGLSIAYAARAFGVQATIVVPHGNNPEKNEGMRALGATVIEHGRDFDQARELLDDLVAEHGYRNVHPADEPVMLAGVGTYALEWFEDAGPLDAVYVPVGLGSGICGVALVRERLSPGTRVIGVQSRAAPAVSRTWKEGHVVTTETADTFADGLATRVPARVTQGIIDRLVDDFTLVSDAEIADAVRSLLRYTHNLAEGAGAAALAAAWKERDALRGQRIGCVLSGGNLDAATLGRIVRGEL